MGDAVRARIGLRSVCDRFGVALGSPCGRFAPLAIRFAFASVACASLAVRMRSILGSHLLGARAEFARKFSGRGTPSIDEDESKVSAG